MHAAPEELSASERYKLLIGCIVPRPIALVSTVSPDGRFNLAPFSFFNGIGSNPLSLLFCPSNRPDGGDKDTLRNIEETGEFVANIVAESERAGLRFVHSIEFGESYSQTLRRWHETFNENWARIAGLGFDERFRRMWNFYLTSCAATFASGNCDVTQITVERPA